jgi:hypothetical protein
MKTNPIKSDSRYTIQKEFCGHPKAMFVLRFCGKFILSSQFYSTVLIRAVGHNAVRMGALVVTEQKS